MTIPKKYCKNGIGTITLVGVEGYARQAYGFFIVYSFLRYAC